MVHFLATLVIGKSSARDTEMIVQNRLFLHSLCEDGDFARRTLKPLASAWVKKIESCHRAAVAAGDAAADPVTLGLRGWFAHHLPAAVMLFTLPSEPAVDYGVSEERMIEQIVWFCLRGIGLTDDAIRRHYNPKALALLST
jgi:hypothetical protein